MRDIAARQPFPPPDLAHRRYEPSLENEEVHLSEYLGILLKRRKLILRVCAAVFILGCCTIFPTTRQYSASATLKIEPHSPLGTVGDAVNSIQYNSGDGYDYYKTQFVLLQSRPLVQRVITDLGLAANSSFLTENKRPFLSQIQTAMLRGIQSIFSAGKALLPTSAAPTTRLTTPTIEAEALDQQSQSLVSRYLELLHIEPVRETRLVRVTFTTPDPRLSQVLANAHAAAFIRTNIETRFELTTEARDFLEKKLVEMRGKVERSERDLDKFRRQYGVVSLEGNDNVVANRMLDLNRRLVEARDKRIEVESLYHALKDKNAQHLSKIIDNDRIQQLKGRLDSLEVEQARMAVMFKPDHPNLHELRTQIAETRQRIEREISTVQRSIESDYRIARTREETLETAADREQDAAMNLKRIGVDYNILDQEAKAHRVLYERLLQRLNETNISNTTTVSNIAIAEEAFSGQAIPSTASRKLFVFTALGLLLGCGFAFFTEYFNAVVETPEKVWRTVGIPTLGVIPHLQSLRQPLFAFLRLGNSASVPRIELADGAADGSQSEELIVFHHPQSVFPESYRAIRTALLYSRETPPPPILLLTSAHPDEGKTLTTLNLAITLAQNEYSVLVIDADMRKGNCHTLLQMENSAGLADILCEGHQLNSCIRSTAVRRLSFLSRGHTPANPTDLLGSLQMKELLAELHGRFDFVLIDSPPALVVSDASVLATLSDGVLLVVNGQKTTLQMLQLLRERLESVRAPLIGIILNAVNLRNPKYSYYRSYYKSYPATNSKKEKFSSANEAPRI